MVRFTSQLIAAATRVSFDLEHRVTRLKRRWPRFLKNLRIKKISFDIVLGPACPRLWWSKATLLGGSTWLSKCVRALHFPLQQHESCRSVSKKCEWNQEAKVCPRFSVHKKCKLVFKQRNFALRSSFAWFRLRLADVVSQANSNGGTQVFLQWSKGGWV